MCNNCGCNADPFAFNAEKKNCGCGQDPCVTYGAENYEYKELTLENLPKDALLNMIESSKDLITFDGDKEELADIEVWDGFDEENFGTVGEYYQRFIEGVNVSRQSMNLKNLTLENLPKDALLNMIESSKDDIIFYGDKEELADREVWGDFDEENFGTVGEYYQEFIDGVNRSRQKYPSVYKDQKIMSGAESFVLKTDSGHEVEWDDGSFYMTFKEPIDGYGAVSGDWYGGEKESPDEISLDVEPAWDEENDDDYDVPSLYIQFDNVEYYGIRNHNMTVSDDRVVSPELSGAIQEGVAWMVADHADKTVVSREYKGESFGAEVEKCPKCDSGNLGKEEMYYCYTCGNDDASEDGCSKCGSDTVGEEEMDYCYTCGGHGHWFNAESFSAERKKKKSGCLHFKYGKHCWAYSGNGAICVDCGLTTYIDEDGKKSYGTRSQPFKGNYDAHQAESFDETYRMKGATKSLISDVLRKHGYDDFNELESENLKFLLYGVFIEGMEVGMDSFGAESFSHFNKGGLEFRTVGMCGCEQDELWEVVNVESPVFLCGTCGYAGNKKEDGHFMHMKNIYDAESFSAESGDKPSCGHADCMDFGMDGWLSDREIVFRYYTQWFNGVGQDEFFAYTGAWKPILALNALSPEDMKDIANTERDVVGCYRGGFNAESFGAEGGDIYIKTFLEGWESLGMAKSRTWISGYFSSYDAAMKDAKEEKDDYERSGDEILRFFEKDGRIIINVIGSAMLDNVEKRTTTIIYEKSRKLGAESFGAESFEAHGIGSDEKCDYCELPMDYCERLRGVKHSPREGGIGRYKLDCHQCGEMYESCPECDGDICFDCHNDICIFCGCNTLKYAAESFEADGDITYIPIYFDDDGEVEVLGIHNQKTKAIASIMESIRKIFEEEKQVGNYGEETFEEFYEYGIEFNKNIDQWGDGSGGIWLIEEYSKTGDDTAWNQGLNRLHKKVFYNESFGAEYGKRQRFGNRYVGRDTKGKFISNVSVGRSLKADRRTKSKTPARSGFGHKGDTQKGASGGFKLPTDAKSVIGIGAVLGGLWAYLESQK